MFILHRSASWTIYYASQPQNKHVRAIGLGSQKLQKRRNARLKQLLKARVVHSRSFGQGIIEQVDIWPSTKYLGRFGCSKQVGRAAQVAAQTPQHPMSTPSSSSLSSPLFPLPLSSLPLPIAVAKALADCSYLLWLWYFSGPRRTRSHASRPYRRQSVKLPMPWSCARQ